jgi:hypothetical protein
MGTKKFLKERKEMSTAVQFLIRGKFGSTELDDRIYTYLYGGDDDIPEEVKEKYVDLVYGNIHERIRDLDKRLWWDPETSTIYWEREDESEEKPDVSDEDIYQAIGEAFDDAQREMGW